MTSAEPQSAASDQHPDSLLDLTQRPTPQAPADRPVCARYRPYRLLSLGWRWALLLLLAVMAAAGETEAPPWLPVLVLPAALAHLVLAWHEAGRRRWGLRTHDLSYASGLLIRRTTLLPLARLQHVETLSGPLERGFGLERVICFTAGGYSADLVMAGLDRDTAARLREFLLDSLDAPSPVGEDRSVDPP